MFYESIENEQNNTTYDNGNGDNDDDDDDGNNDDDDDDDDINNNNNNNIIIMCGQFPGRSDLVEVMPQCSRGTSCYAMFTMWVSSISSNVTTLRFATHH